MLLLTELLLSLERLKRKTVSVHQRRRELVGSKRKLIQKAVAVHQFDAAEKEIVRTLVPFFNEQGRSMISRLRNLEKKSSKGTLPVDASGIVSLIFNPDEWHDELIDRTLPVLAVKMAEAAVAHLMTLGIDVRRKLEKGTKATTASEWVVENTGDWNSLSESFEASGIPMGVMAEIPTWMQNSIAERLVETFSQDYWDDVSRTTMMDAERVLSQGLSEGWSIDEMAKRLRKYYADDGFRYARRRSENIARTESGNALNGARKDSVSQLQKELGPQVPMKQSWLSVLSQTTRGPHADLDGVPEDANGMWNLAGYNVPWPGHVSLPPGQRCNCFSAGVLASGDFIGSQRAWYEGRFAKIVTGKGTVLTLTANHPVVTRKGLVAACMIQPGDQVLTYDLQVDRSFLGPSVFQESPFGIGLSGFGNDGCNYVDHKPISVKEIFETFSMISAIEVKPASICDFYGDGKSIQGNIEIVRTNGILPEDVESIIREEREDVLFGSSGTPGVLSSALGVGGQCELFSRCLHTSSSSPSLAKHLLSKLRSVFGISPSYSLGVGTAANFNASLTESSREDGPCISSFLCESLQRYPGFVEFDNVVEVGDFYRAGHIYDLQSRYGLIVAADPLSHTDNGFQPRGIVTSNCMCTLTIEFGMDDAAAQQEIEEYWARVVE